MISGGGVPFFQTSSNVVAPTAALPTDAIPGTGGGHPFFHTASKAEQGIGGPPLRSGHWEGMAPLCNSKPGGHPFF